MRKKYKFISFVLMIFSVTFLTTSCNFLDIFSSLINKESSESLPDYSEESESIPEGANYYRDTYSKYTYYDMGQKSLYGAKAQKAIGNQKTLVIPVSIKGFEKYATASTRKRIEYAFFGTEKDTGWESVSSYFYKSSYGKLNLTGEVTPWFEIGLTPLQITTKNYEDTADLGTIYVLNKAVEWAKNQGYKMTDYDLDKDGYIDSVWLVYGAPDSTNYVYTKSVQELMWAFTYWDYSNLNNGSKTNPVPNVYAWASFDFMDGAKTNGISIDAHTYIHEHGHVFGLEDYYDYDSLHSPLGCVDMQDYNVGDHNAYSKYALGWLKPYVVTGDCEITIKSSALYGDAIFVGNSKSHAFDEYLLIEFLTPEGVWEQDSKSEYPSIRSKTYTSPGVRILHVDGRLITHDDEITTSMDNKHLYAHAYSNTPSESYSTGTRTLRNDLVALVSADNDSRFQTNEQEVANNSSLFKKGMTFDIADYNSFFKNAKLHNDETIPYEITIKNITNESATISFKTK